MASSEAIASIKHASVMVRNARKGFLNEWSRTGRVELRLLLYQGDISPVEYYRALTLIDNAYANRLRDGLPAQFRRQLLAPAGLPA